MARGLITVFLLAIFPLLLRNNFDGIPTTRDLGLMFALSGGVLFSLNFILTTRIKPLESFFKGLNNAYIVHHLIGQISLILLCFHPVLIGLYYIKNISYQAASSVLFPYPIKSSQELSPWLGTFALILFIVLLILTIFVNLPYEVWKKTHKLMGIPVFLALLHMATIQGDIQTNYLLKYYMFFIFGAGLAAYIYGTLLGRFLSKKYRYIVSDIITKEGINLITLKPEGAAIKKYTPGQFVFVKFHSLGIPNEFHPFSLTSSPNENFLSLAIKSSGDYTETIKLLKKGSVAIVDGAYGGFSYLHSPRKRQIWVAGGIGITPFVSMAKDLKEKEEYNVKLYYTVSEKNEAVFAETLEKIDKECENFELVLWITKTQGRITANQIMQDEKDHKGIDIFICGPTKMMKDLRRQFNSLGIRNSHIFSEEFSLN